MRNRSRAFVLEAYSTTHIEGAQLTLEESELLLSGKKLSSPDPDDIKELFNYRKAFDKKVLIVAGSTHHINYRLNNS